MSENSSQATSFKDSLKNASEAITSRQQETINRLVVYNNLSEVIGRNAANVINEAFNGPEDTTEYTHDIKAAINRLKLTTYDGSEFRMVRAYEDKSIPFLIRKTIIVPGKLERTEIFILPHVMLEHSEKESSFACIYYLITDLSTGKVVDLNSAKTKSSLLLVTAAEQYKSEIDDERRRIHLSESFKDHDDDLTYYPFQRSQLLKNATNFVHLHESGHSHQIEFGKLEESEDQESKQTIKDKLVQIVEAVIFGTNKVGRTKKQRLVDIKTERNASAFALSVIRKYRSLGLDLCPNMSNTELVRLVNFCLNSRKKDKRVKEHYTKMKL